MRTLKEKIALIKEVCGVYGIHILTDGVKHDWPLEHSYLFSTAFNIMNVRYEDFLTWEGEKYERWRPEKITAIKTLQDKACRAKRKNESNWRAVYEQFISDAINSETTCESCRQRVWISFISAPHNSGNKGTENLENRQSDRKPCSCYENGWPKQNSELSKIFVDYSEETIPYSDDLARRTKQNYRRADRIYGLQLGTAFERVQEGVDEEHPIRALLHEQPVRADSGMKLLFPYLLIEAKSDDAGYGWDQILFECAVATYICLEAQQRVRSTASNAGVSGWKSGPLLWLFTNRGADWRMYAAYLKDAPGLSGPGIPYETQIVEICHGNIHHKDDALHLALLIDLIKDWARDDYREALIAEFEAIKHATGPNPSARCNLKRKDSDIFSMCASQPSQDQPSQNSESSQGSMHSAMTSLDKENNSQEDLEPFEEQMGPRAAKRQRTFGSTGPITWHDFFDKQGSRQSNEEVDKTMPQPISRHRRERSLYEDIASSRLWSADPKVLKPLHNIKNLLPVSKPQAKLSSEETSSENLLLSQLKRKRMSDWCF